MLGTCFLLYRGLKISPDVFTKLIYEDYGIDFADF